VWTVVSHNPLISTIVGGIVVLLVSGLLVFDGGDGNIGPGPSGGGPTAGQQINTDPPDNAMEQIEQRSFWLAPPETLDDADVEIGYTTEVLGGDVTAVTPRDLVEDPANYEGSSVYLVGKVVATQGFKVDEGYYSGEVSHISQEYRIKGTAPGFDAYIGTDPENFAQIGDVIYALGRLAAVGESRAFRGGSFRTAYFLTLGTVEFDSLSLPDSVAPSIRDAAKGLRNPRRSHGSLPLF
jgi:hypothetical protein